MKKFEREINRAFKKNTFLIAMAFPYLLGGCNTMEGVGTDIQKAGKALEESAERNKQSCPSCP
ncbi:MAG: hypothetical protein BGO67_09245 [Alphaproteobacteria bacterium 41-28]|nr:MAG: hypothetical protein BGO67_09245 [Alphaproteobacteria bacterium 41-28]